MQSLRFAAALVHGRDAALVTPEPVLRLLDEAIAAAADPMPLAIARAGLASHGLALGAYACPVELGTNP